MAQRLIYNEGGVNVAWFTELELNEARTAVKILARYRLMWRDHIDWPDHCKEAPRNERNPWSPRGDDFVVVHYYTRTHGWLPISNPKCVFDYCE